MRVFYTILILILGSALTLKAQTPYPDLIVPRSGDSIRCVFWIIRETEILYLVKGTYGIPMKEEIKKAAIAYFDKDFYARREPGQVGKPTRLPDSYYQNLIDRQISPEARANTPTEYPDLVVTHKGDTIQCFIKDASKGHLAYLKPNMMGNAVRRKLPAGDVAYKERGYYRRHPSRRLSAAEPEFVHQDLLYLRIEVGGAYQVARGAFPLVLQNFERQYRSGTTLSAQLALMATRKFGIGFRMERFGTSAEDNALKLKTKVEINYIGGELVGRYLTEHWGRSHLYTHLGLGAARYKENLTIDNDQYTGSGTGLAFRLGLGAQYSLMPHLAAHAGLEGLYGGVPVTITGSKVSASAPNQDKPIQVITRVGAVIGVTFSF